MWDYLCHLVMLISMWLISMWLISVWLIGMWSFHSVKKKEASLCTVASLKHDAVFLGINLAISIKNLKYELFYLGKLTQGIYHILSKI